ncbi:MAG: DUF4412 domain-containing protein [Planctomycetes bacterium]|nr:DUF4412 domain-containing protein [Planctomycetota bacterium]
MTRKARKSQPRLRLGFLSFLLLTPAAAACPVLTGQATTRAIIFEQKVSGLPGLQRPGQKEEKPALHRVTVELSGQRLAIEALVAEGEAGAKEAKMSERGANRIILRLDLETPRIYEIFDSARQYRVHAGDLNRLQVDRDIFEQDMLRRMPKFSAAEQEDLLKQNHLRRDGKRLVEVKTGGIRPILGYNCQEVLVTENGRRVVRAWMTRDIGGGKSFYQLYRRLGAFSEEVLQKIDPVEGFPLEAEIKVITALPSYDLKAECVQVKESEVNTEIFELPPGYEEIKDPPPVASCPVCGKKFEWDQPGGRYFEGNRELRFCSKDCLKKFVAQMKERALKGPENKK